MHDALIIRNAMVAICIRETTCAYDNCRFNGVGLETISILHKTPRKPGPNRVLRSFRIGGCSWPWKQRISPRLREMPSPVPELTPRPGKYAQSGRAPSTKPGKLPWESPLRRIPVLLLLTGLLLGSFD